MNYKVLYRKYRPNCFENIVGQDYIVTTLKNSIINNNVSHAYIFSGPRGTGKTSTAKVFAKTLNCINNSNGISCEKCDFCQSFVENPDVIEIDAASNNGVDEIRNLIDNVKLTPTNGKYKIYIIDEVHMLTNSAFNALLLTLEEPPSHVIFILATTNIENVPITILSRCQRFDFQKISLENLVFTLKNICEKENIEAEEDALKEISYLSEGGLRDALSILDQLSKNSKKITLADVEKQLKTISEKVIYDLLEDLENNNIENLLKTINEFRSKSVDYKTLIKKIIDISSKKIKNIKTTGRFNKLNYSDYKKLILELCDAITKININVDPFIIIELCLLDYIDDINNKNIEIVTENLNESNIILNENSKTQTNVRNKHFVDTRINNCFSNVKKDYLEKCKRLLNELKANVGIIGKIKSILLDSTLVAASDKNVILTTINEHAAEDANNYVKDVESILKSEYNLNVKVIFISEKRWLIEKNKYIENIKSGYIYEYIEEIDESNNESIVNDVFDMSKVEIV